MGLTPVSDVASVSSWPSPSQQSHHSYTLRFSSNFSLLSPLTRSFAKFELLFPSHYQGSATLLCLGCSRHLAVHDSSTSSNPLACLVCYWPQLESAHILCTILCSKHLTNLYAPRRGAYKRRLASSSRRKICNTRYRFYKDHKQIQ